jgi:pimeloyl-ACP methyl ester carboxylesterase
VRRATADRDDVVRRWNVPTIILAGEVDQSCGIESIRALAGLLKQRGAPAELVSYSGMGHDFSLSVGLDREFRRRCATTHAGRAAPAPWDMTNSSRRARRHPKSVT